MNDELQNLKKQIELLENRIHKLESFMISKAASIPNESMPVKKLSEKEYLIQKTPKDDVQNTFYLAGYLEKIKGMSSFTVDDLKVAFQSAKVPPPSNLNDKVNKNIIKGLFMEAGTKENKKAWVLTATGEIQLSIVPKK